MVFFVDYHKFGGWELVVGVSKLDGTLDFISRIIIKKIVNIFLK
jgi:hypothetical protein